MRRRDLLRALGSIGLLSAVPLAGCADGTRDVQSATAASSPTPPMPATTSATAPIGGRLVQARSERSPAAPAPAVRHKLLPASAALYRAALPGNGNALLSPYSIISALGMLALGARGATATALAAVLGGDAATVATWLSGTDAALSRAVTAAELDNGQTARPIVEPANVLFLRQGAQVKETFLDALASDYGAGVREVDFTDKSAARTLINDWVATRTRKLIPQLIPAGFVDASTLLVLVKALYLKAAWANPFEPGDSKETFTTLSGPVSVPFMTRSDKIAYATGRNWQAVSIPLVSGLAMTVIVPDAGHFREISDGLSPDLLAAAAAGEERQVDLAMPAFNSDTPTDLQPAFGALGLGQLFGSPDLSGIAGDPGQLFVSGAVHQARITIDANGVEAAAATAIAVAMSGAPPAALRVDRPFLYLVHDIETVTPLFLGRITDPTA